jgi:hypothetical protein
MNMNDDSSWDRIVDAIDSKFGLDRHGRLTRPIEDRLDLTESVAFIEFERAGEKYRLERVTGPAITDKRAIGGHRVGAQLRYENTYDTSELVHRTIFLKENAGEWDKIDPSQLELG